MVYSSKVVVYNESFAQACLLIGTASLVNTVAQRPLANKFFFSFLIASFFTFSSSPELLGPEHHWVKGK